ncbi:MAG: LysR family transcriptional regulator [Thiothrix sp.]|nr:LysR family transcriptional regulator [Thiothrix sp.]
MPHTYHLSGRFWIESSQGMFLGQGRVTLLERIREHGSISAAARSMKMSYRQAWDQVNAMNSHSPAPLVSSATGGRGGGGASLTETGEQAVALFQAVKRDFDAFLLQRSTTLQL